MISVHKIKSPLIIINFSSWIGDKTTFSNNYDVDPLVTGAALRDGSFIASPIGGWFAALQQNQSLLNGLLSSTTASKFNSYIDFSISTAAINVFNVNQQRSGSIYSYDPSVQASLIGTKALQNSILALPANDPSFVPASTSSGLFDTIGTKYYVGFTQNPNGPGAVITSYNPFPFYNYTAGNDDALDDILATRINDALNKVALLDKTALLSGTTFAKTQLYQTISGLLKDLPYGGII